MGAVSDFFSSGHGCADSAGFTTLCLPGHWCSMMATSRSHLFATDAIGYDNLVAGSGKNFTEELRRRIAARTRLRADAIMVTSTHAHSTPETIGLTPFLEVPGVAGWVEQHLETLAEVVVAAWKHRSPAAVRFGKTTVEGVARNRRIRLKNGTLNRYGKMPDETLVAIPPAVDEELSWLCVEDRRGRPRAVVLNFTAHPVVTMLLPSVSADFPGAASNAIEKAFPDSICLFTNGAAGDVNSVFVSTSHDDAIKLGVKLADAAIADINRKGAGQVIQSPTIQFASRTVHLDARDCPVVSEAKKIAEQDPIQKTRDCFVSRTSWRKVRCWRNCR